MNSKPSVFSAIVITIISMIFITAIVIGSQGKTKMNYTAEVKVENGALTGDSGQSIYMTAPGEECTFEVTAEGAPEISSTIMIYKDSTAKDSYISVEASEKGTVSEAVKLTGDAALLQVVRSVKAGTTVQDGTYKIDYTIRAVSTGRGGKILLTVLLAVVLTILGVVVINHENNKARTCTKKQMRLRGKAYTNAFMVMFVLGLAFGFLSGITEQFPFSIFQVELIAFLISATVFLITADRSRAFRSIRRKRGTLVVVFAIIAGVNLFAVLLSLIMKNTAAASFTGTGVIGNWIVNLVAAVCFFVMMLELLMQDAREQAERG